MTTVHLLNGSQVQAVVAVQGLDETNQPGDGYIGTTPNGETWRVYVVERVDGLVVSDSYKREN